MNRLKCSSFLGIIVLTKVGKCVCFKNSCHHCYQKRCCFYHEEILVSPHPQVKSFLLYRPELKRLRGHHLLLIMYQAQQMDFLLLDIIKPYSAFRRNIPNPNLILMSITLQDWNCCFVQKALFCCEQQLTRQWAEMPAKNPDKKWSRVQLRVELDKI